MQFSRTEIREQLAATPASSRVALALAAAQRMANACFAWDQARGASPYELCEALWDALIINSHSEDVSIRSRIDAISATTDDDEDSLLGNLADCAAALQYTWEAWKTGSVDSAGYALERAWEASSQNANVLVGEPPGIFATQDVMRSETERVENHPMVVRELEAQARDRETMLQGIGGRDPMVAIRDRSRNEALLTRDEIVLLRKVSGVGDGR
jgi:hypothetical protein